MITEKMYLQHATTPSDINEHLPTLRSYGQKCNHITEMGVRWVVSTWALLIAKPNTLVSYDINYHPSIENIKQSAKQDKVDFTFIQEDVLKASINETDLLFIDTLHNYHQLVKELDIHSKNVRKYIIFHDTTTFGYADETPSESVTKGVRPAIEQFLLKNKQWNLVDVYANNNGLSVIQKGDWGIGRVTGFSQYEFNKK